MGLNKNQLLFQLGANIAATQFKISKELQKLENRSISDANRRAVLIRAAALQRRLAQLRNERNRLIG